jgi:hypothetical protein
MKRWILSIIFSTSYHNSHSKYNRNNTSHGGGGASYQSNNNSSNSSSYLLSQQLPLAITQLRGLSTHPTNSIYLAELHWVKRDGLN